MKRLLAALATTTVALSACEERMPPPRIVESPITATGCRAEIEVGDDDALRATLVGLSTSNAYLVCPFSARIPGGARVLVIGRDDICEDLKELGAVTSIPGEAAAKEAKACSPVFSSREPRHWAEKRDVYIWRYRGSDDVDTGQVARLMEAYMARGGMPFVRLVEGARALCFEVPKAEGRSPSALLAPHDYKMPADYSEEKHRGNCDQVMRRLFGEPIAEFVE